MMPFSTGTGLEHVGVVGPKLGLHWAGLQALALLSSAKTRKEKGQRGASPVVAPMLKLVPP